MAIVTFKAGAKNLPEGLMVETAARDFKVLIDEPESLGGTDKGMNPVELLLSALGACQAIVARVYAPTFDIDLKDFRVELEGDLDVDGFMCKSDVRPGFQEIRYKMVINADITAEKAQEFASFIEKTCPVGDTIANPVSLVSAGVLVEKEQSVSV
ncbi:OsmC family protein [Bacillus marinisedimentorum]|uniref:OsmC family protein n=1 Tax=Bacillus marinisedimentorum TaxID=1821260 RepID=UPI000871E525|nr:OsmC family protein [Bacillus marinisedimentorum]